VFELTQIVPSIQAHLAAVAGKIQEHLRDEQQSRAIAKLTTTWRHKWQARTTCNPGWIIPQCQQYTGPTPGGQGQPFTNQP
jgi:hypothetical protein